MRSPAPPHSDRPLLGLLVAAPLLDEDGAVLPEEERAPFRGLPALLDEALARAGWPLRLEARLLTFRHAIEVLPRADVLLLCCAGLPGALAAEDERGRLRPLGLREDLPALLSGPAPRAALLLGPGTVEAAAALRDLGVPVTLGLGERLPREAIAALCATFIGALGAGHGPGAAARLARAGSGRPDAVQLFGGGDDGPPRPHLAPAPDRWEAPPPAPDLVERPAELAQLLDLVEGPGLVALCGAAGVGKSELLRALAERCRLGRHPTAGGALRDLRGCATARDLLEALGAAAAGSPEAAGRALGQGGAMLLLDHACELLEDGEGRAALLQLLSAALAEGRARIVIATQAAAPLPGALLRLGALRPEAGRALLRPSAAAAADPALPELLDALSGHPLALRLAAAQLADGQPPARVLRALREQGDLRAPGGGAGLAAALSPALGRLIGERPGAAELLQLIGELPGGLPGEAALSPEDEADLRALRRENLVELLEGGHVAAGPVVACARAAWAPSPSPARRRALRAAALAALGADLQRRRPLLGTVRAPAALAALARWRPLLDVLLPEAGAEAGAEALGAADEIARYGGLGAAADAWCRAAEEWPAPGAALLSRLAAAALRRGDGERARQAAVAALAAATKEDRPGAAGHALLCLSQLALAEDKREQAEARAAQARAQLQRAGDGPGEAQALLRLGALLAPSRPQAARERYQEALALCRAVEDGRGACAARRGLSELAQRAGRLAEAQALCEAALRDARAIACAEEEAAALRQLGELGLADAGRTAADDEDDEGAERLAEARARFEEALRRFRALADPGGQARALLGLGRLCLLDERPEEALALGEQALALLSGRPEPRGRAEALLLLAAATEALGARLLDRRGTPRTPRLTGLA